VTLVVDVGVVEVATGIGTGAGTGAGAPGVSMWPASTETASVKLSIVAAAIWRKVFMFLGVS
jgi:hypothetical protein